MDDGSVDNSVDIIRRFENRLAHWETGPNRGQYQVINAAFKKSTGAIMGWINSDDMHLPWTLHVVAECFYTIPRCPMAFQSRAGPLGLSRVLPRLPFGSRLRSNRILGRPYAPRMHVRCGQHTGRIGRSFNKSPRSGVARYGRKPELRIPPPIRRPPVILHFGGGFTNAPVWSGLACPLGRISHAESTTDEPDREIWATVHAALEALRSRPAGKGMLGARFCIEPGRGTLPKVGHRLIGKYGYPGENREEGCQHSNRPLGTDEHRFI